MTEGDDKPILVADVGGTNLNLALVVRKHSRFQVLRKARFNTQEEDSLLVPIQRFLASEPALKPVQACLSGAGPVFKRCIHLTNAPWDINATALEQALGFPVQVVNDFTALSCGVLQLDLEDSRQLTALPHGDGSLPVPDPGGLVLVVGAGTGLGVGFVVRTSAGDRAFPSEGGHIGLPIFDEDTLPLWQHLQAGLPGPPGAEMAVSGPGLVRLLRFLLASGRETPTLTTDSILALPLAEQPAAMTAQASSDAACGRAMALFVALYARVCAELCAAFLPTGGLFLAGGIVSKNAGPFLDGGRFMAHFERNYRTHLDQLTRATPVYLVHDYDVSLVGAAHALAAGPQDLPAT